MVVLFKLFRVVTLLFFVFFGLIFGDTHQSTEYSIFTLFKSWDLGFPYRVIQRQVI